MCCRLSMSCWWWYFEFAKVFFLSQPRIAEDVLVWAKGRKLSLFGIFRQVWTSHFFLQLKNRRLWRGHGRWRWWGWTDAADAESQRISIFFLGWSLRDWSENAWKRWHWIRVELTVSGRNIQCFSIHLQKFLFSSTNSMAKSCQSSNSTNLSTVSPLLRHLIFGFLNQWRWSTYRLSILIVHLFQCRWKISLAKPHTKNHKRVWKWKRNGKLFIS